MPGSFFTMIGPECRLDLFWDNISSEDVWRVSNGKVSFGVWYSEDRDLFFLYRFEGFCSETFSGAPMVRAGCRGPHSQKMRRHAQKKRVPPL